MKNPLYHAILAGALLVGTALPLCSQETQPTNTLGGTNRMWHQQMKAFHQQMAAEIKAAGR